MLIHARLCQIVFLIIVLNPCLKRKQKRVYRSLNRDIEYEISSTVLLNKFRLCKVLTEINTFYPKIRFEPITFQRIAWSILEI